MACPTFPLEKDKRKREQMAFLKEIAAICSFLFISFSKGNPIFYQKLKEKTNGSAKKKKENQG